MSGPRWPVVALGEVAPLRRRLVELQPEQVYREVGARSFGRGLFDKPDFRGSDLTWEKPFWIHAGDLVFSNIKAWEGAVAVAGDEHHGRVASHRYLTCVPDTRRALGRYILHYLLTADGLAQLGAASPGSADRNRTLSTRALAAIRIPLPPLAEQERIVARLDGAAERIARRAEAVKAVEAELGAMLQAAFRRITAGAPVARLGDVAPLVRRPVTVEPNTIYKEVGARSFGRGLFRKPDVCGGDLTWQQLFGIEEGDLVFSNIKAWEGAFAVAGAAHHGCVGSHRYLTCVPDKGRTTPGFAWFYLQSPKGLSQVQAASPGSADRNRTLSTRALADLRMPLPSLDAQRAFDRLHAKAEAALAAQRAASAELDKLIPALLHETFGAEAAAATRAAAA